jgi:tripartite ATP-independent transporter DctM subunit
MLIASSAFLIQQHEVLLSIPQRLMAGPNNYPILAIPFFVLAGLLMNLAGITDRIFNFCIALVGHFTGSLGHVNVLASMIFAGMSGSGAADAAGLGTIELAAMRKEGYDDDFNVGVTLGSATIGPIIPPSIPMVVYGSVAGVSVGALFVGGVIPGILMGLTLMVMVYIIARRRHYPTHPRASLRELAVATRKAFWALMTPVVVLVGIVCGIFTPTEAAIVTVAYALFLGIFVYKELNLALLRSVLLESIETTSVVLFIMAAATLFAWIITRQQIPTILMERLLSISHDPLILLLMINVFLLVVGCFMDGNAALIILVPVFMPLLKVVNINPVFFGVVAVLNFQIGALTPPVGSYLYIMTRVANMSFENVVKATMPWLIPLMIVLLGITVYPPLVMWLPTLLGLGK